jgi:hypothetical protein|eukprot:5212678-Prymnesium_polylepis.2
MPLAGPEHVLQAAESAACEGSPGGSLAPSEAGDSELAFAAGPHRPHLRRMTAPHVLGMLSVIPSMMHALRGWSHSG